jgi:soluble lytic murein transglycosylase-like protein
MRHPRRDAGGARLAIIAAAAAIALLAGPGPGHASAADAPAGDPYAAAAHSAGVPLDLLVAVAGAESGYHPYALNVGGREIYCQSRAEAERILATGDNADIGLMQINWTFWGPRLHVSKSALLDPRINLYYGARILKEGLVRRGSIWRRISNYHSGDAHTRERYSQQVYAAYLRYLHGDTR